MNKKPKFIVQSGHFNRGFHYYGPFDTREEAYAFIKKNIDGYDYPFVLELKDAV